MPSNWGSINLGRVCTKIGSGATPRGGKDVYLSSGPYALIRSQNVLNDGFRHDGLAYIGPQHASELANVEVLDTDVLLNITGDSVARVCQVDPRVLPARVNQHVAIIRPDPEVLHARFLRYVLVSSAMQAKLFSWAGAGGTRNALTKGMIESLDASAPLDIDEQRAIAHILGTLDDKIELNRRMNETLEAMAMALFKAWFVDFEPVRAKINQTDSGLPQHIADLFPNRLVKSDLGEVPAQWCAYTLDDLAQHHTRSIAPNASPSSQFEHFSIPAFDISQTPILEQGADIKSNKTLVPKGSVLLSKLNPDIPRVWIPNESDGPLQVCSTEFLAFTPSVSANRSLIYSLFSDQAFRTTLRSMVTGTSKSHQRVPPKALKNRQVLLGTPALFRLFGELTTPWLCRTIANRAESQRLAATRDALIPSLVSGEIRLPRAEDILAAAL